MDGSSEIKQQQCREKEKKKHVDEAMKEGKTWKANGGNHFPSPNDCSFGLLSFFSVFALQSPVKSGNACVNEKLNEGQVNSKLKSFYRFEHVFQKNSIEGVGDEDEDDT